MNNSIKVSGAREHNLKNIDIEIPKNKLVVITGLSGSGKSSLAFDTIFAEGQRRYMESFSAYSRQFMGDLERPDVDSVTGLSPVISIEQKTTNKNPRSTVGTITEVYDFLRLLYANIGIAYSYNTGKKMERFSENQIAEYILENYNNEKITILAPVIKGRKGHYRELLEQLRKQGYLKARIDGEIKELAPKMQLDRYKIHDIEVVIDRIAVKEKDNQRITQSILKALEVGEGLMMIHHENSNEVRNFSKLLMCADTGLSYPEPSPNSFSFNSPYGYCPECLGLGTLNQISDNLVIPDADLSINDGGIKPLGESRDNWTFKIAANHAKKHKISLSTPINKLPEHHLNLMLYGNEEGLKTYTPSGQAVYHENLSQQDYEGVINMLLRWYHETTSDAIREWAESFMTLVPCPSCHGAKLKKDSLWIKIDEKNIAEISLLPLNQLNDWINNLEKKLTKSEQLIAHDILIEIKDRLQFLLNVGLHYLHLNRQSRTLSGGESQRIRLATQIGSQLTGITYILDEPSIGLHQRDNQQLIEALKKLRDGNNTVIVVEHDKDIMLAADYIFDIGPGAGKHGGRIVAEGTPKQFVNGNSTTAKYLKGEIDIEYTKDRNTGNGNELVLKGAKGNNLNNVSIQIPLGTFTCVTGVSGSGKSTLVNDTLYPILAKHCYPTFKGEPMAYKSIEGLEHIDKVIEINQSPIGRTPRSNPATYCGFFNDIRTLFSQVPEAKIRGYKAGRFSFNVKGGRCEHCQGGGMRTIEMNFLPDVYVPCEICNGQRYNRETLEIRYKGKSISDVLNLTVDEAVVFFENIPFIFRKIKTLQDVGLGYITLGQSATTLSGGEAQRVKIATELSKRDTGKTFYILDEPSTGLHFQDIKLLLSVLKKLVEKGNTVLVIEHNMDMIKVADYIIDIGPDAGINGGKIVACGTPEKVASSKNSITGKFLKAELK